MDGLMDRWMEERSDVQTDTINQEYTGGQSGVHKTSTPSTPVGYQVGYKVGYIRGFQQIEAEEGKE